MPLLAPLFLSPQKVITAPQQLKKRCPSLLELNPVASDEALLLLSEFEKLYVSLQLAATLDTLMPLPVKEEVQSMKPADCCSDPQKLSELSLKVPSECTDVVYFLSLVIRLAKALPLYSIFFQIRQSQMKNDSPQLSPRGFVQPNIGSPRISIHSPPDHNTTKTNTDDFKEPKLKQQGSEQFVVDQSPIKFSGRKSLQDKTARLKMCRLCEELWPRKELREHTIFCRLCTRLVNTSPSFQGKIIMLYTLLSQLSKNDSDVRSYGEMIEKKEQIPVIGTIAEKTVIQRINKILQSNQIQTIPTLELSFNSGKNALEGIESSLKVEDFLQLKLFSAGGYSKVFLVRKKTTGDIYAMKKISKEGVMRKNITDRVVIEKQMLEKCGGDHVVRLFYAFQDNGSLYLVMEFCPGGDLSSLLANVGILDEEAAKRYCGEIVLALETIHSCGCIHRDLKPGNILIDKTGHVKLTDFGLSVLGSVVESPETVLCTPDYTAPETFTSCNPTVVSDYFSLGCILYEMLFGIPPFTGETPAQIFAKISRTEVEFPSGFDISDEAKDIICLLLQREPEKRLGWNGSNEVKSHPFFSGIDWNNLSYEDRSDLFVPELVGDDDTGYFEDDIEQRALNMRRLSLISDIKTKDIKGFDCVVEASLAYRNEKVYGEGIDSSASDTEELLEP
ncbi:non-specific serine/threonine protein kinase [Entamoeba marina]